MPTVDVSEQVNRVIALLPKDEQTGAVLLAGNLMMLHKHFHDFAAAVGLLEHADSMRLGLAPGSDQSVLLDAWNHIACRDAVMTLYHFGEVIKSMRRIPLTVSLIDRVDGRRIRAAANKFALRFPTIRQARNGVGHVAEMTSNLDGHRKHAENGTVYFGGLKGRAYTITNDRAHHTIMMTSETREDLRKILHEVHASHEWLAGPRDDRKGHTAPLS